ncbi:MAG: ABC transporter substrate-binding protein [Candidatus Tectimicrobiota bacterium]
MPHADSSHPIARRTLLTGAGLGTLALASGLVPWSPQSWAAGERSRFVSTWNAPDILDPHVKYDVGAAAFNLNLYDNLLRYAGNPPVIVPWLAESETVSDDGRTWTFHLRRGVKFHDGSELTAQAVHFSFTRLLALGKAPAGVFKRMGLSADKIVVRDPYTVEFRLTQAFGPFRVALPIVSIVNPALIKAHEQNSDWAEAWLAQNEAGSGAYRLVKFDQATGFLMERFPEFWRGWAGQHVDEVEIRIIREQSSRTLALMKGNVHMIETLLGPDHLEKLEKHPRLKVTPYESMRFFLLRLHNQREPLNDVYVRKALSHAFNYESFIRDIMKERVVRNPVPLPRPLWGYPQDLAGYDYNLDKAKDYLARARVKITRPLEVHVQAPQEPTVQAALLFQSDLAKLGIELKIVKSLFPSLVAASKTMESTPDMLIHWVSTYFVDPENWIGEMYDSSSGGSWKACSWYKNPQVDTLLRQARGLIDQEARSKLYAEACRLIVEEAADLWIYNTVEHVPLAKNVQGFQFSIVGSGQEFWPVYFAGKA